MVRRLIGSNTTNSSGVATINYTGTGSGKVKIIAESGNLVSEPYTFYDAKYKDMGTSSDHTTTNWSTTTMDVDWTTDPTCTTLTALDSSVFSSRYNNIASYTSRPLTIEFDCSMTYIDADQFGVGMSLRIGASSTGGASWSAGQVAMSSGEWYHITIVLNETTATLQVNNNTPVSRNISVVQNRFYFTINSGTTNTSTRYRNFIIY